MDKNWLIRTKSNHILGPISKDKVIELHKNGSIKADDEVCSGNGFWFFVREDDMVEKFLSGNDTQGFNPISEAKDVITALPSSIPHEITRDDITLVGGINLDDLNRPAVTHAPGMVHEPEVKKKDKLETLAIPSSTPHQKIKSHKKVSNQIYLQYLIYVGFAILVSVLYFRKNIIRYLFQNEATSSFSLIQEVHAQEEISEKKKSF